MFGLLGVRDTLQAVVAPREGSIALERKTELDIGDGNKVPVTELGYRTSAEHWNEYLADDGTVLRLKLVATNLYRLDGQYEPDGAPRYLLKSTNIMAVSAAEDLRQDPS